YDLPIAVELLIATGQAPPLAEPALFLGELSLHGAHRDTAGILPMVSVARDHQISTVFVPAADAREAALVEGVTILPVSTLGELLAHLRGQQQIVPQEPTPIVAPDSDTYPVDFSDVRGQEHVKRALEVAA